MQFGVITEEGEIADAAKCSCSHKRCCQKPSTKNMSAILFHDYSLVAFLIQENARLGQIEGRDILYPDISFSHLLLSPHMRNWPRNENYFFDQILGSITQIKKEKLSFLPCIWSFETDAF